MGGVVRFVLAMSVLCLGLACRSNGSDLADAGQNAGDGSVEAGPVLDSESSPDAVRFVDVPLPADLPSLVDAVEAVELADEPDGDALGDAGDLVSEVAEPAPEFLFSFAVLADPHVDGNPAHREYLVRAVDRVVAEQDARSIELVFIVGDIAWGGTTELSNLADAKGILDGLEEAGMHYVPVLGDNEVQGGAEEEFHEVFGPQYDLLAGVLDNWDKMPGPTEDGLTLENFSFDHGGCHFICPDFISREPGNEGADLHDFVDGSWPWLQADIEAATQGPLERINLVTHHGMFRTGFESVDKYLFPEEAMAQVVEFLCPYRDYIAASYGGHIHQNWVWDVACESGESIYAVWVTDDGFDAVAPPEPDDDRITIRVVAVWQTAAGMEYEQELLVEQIDGE